VLELAFGHLVLGSSAAWYSAWRFRLLIILLVPNPTPAAARR